MINFVRMEFVYTYNTIHNFAKKITPLLKYKLVFLEGELGSGKTTLIKQFCKELGFKNQVTSPTFPLLNIYKNNEKNIYHADLYRLNNIDEINELGFYEVMESNNWFFVDKGNGVTEVTFDIDFEIKNKFLNSLMIISFQFGLEKIADAFQKRAEKLFSSSKN